MYGETRSIRNRGHHSKLIKRLEWRFPLAQCVVAIKLRIQCVYAIDFNAVMKHIGLNNAFYPVRNAIELSFDIRQCRLPYSAILQCCPAMALEI